MKKIIFIISLSLSFHALSAPTEEEISFCQKEGARYGDGMGKDELPLECENHFRMMARPQAIKKSSDQDLTVFGFKNIVFVKDPKVKRGRQNIIAGMYTELKDVISVAIDEVHKEIAVLESSGDILFFSSVITGNVAPLRILRARELEGAHEISVNPETNEVLALHKTGQDLLVFSRLANIHGREGHKKLSLSYRVRNVQGEMLSYNLGRKELMVLNSQKDSIDLYREKKFIKRVSIGIKNVKRIDYSQKNDEIIAVGVHQVIKLPLTEAAE